MAEDRTFKPALAYNVLTPLYDRIVTLLGFGEPFKAHVAKLANVKPGETVLDVACGSGMVLKVLETEGLASRLVGIDPDPEILATAQRKMGEGVELMEAFAQDLPFDDRTFDVVISSLAFHHMPDDVKRHAAAEIKRVLKPHGRFLLADFGKPEGAVETFLLRLGSIFDGRSNMRANLAGELPGLLEDAGFRMHEVARPEHGVHFMLGET